MILKGVKRFRFYDGIGFVPGTMFTVHRARLVEGTVRTWYTVSPVHGPHKDTRFTLFSPDLIELSPLEKLALAAETNDSSR